jgi:(E)-4-hydroxy-3-methylbut-2-enyl-diphosphate synthase
LALAATLHGADKIRINPGNIGGREALTDVVNAAKAKAVPIRVGVNSGSLERGIAEKYQGVSAAGLVESALEKVAMIEEAGYDQIVVSLKSSDVLMTVAAYEQMAEKCAYPLHLGITEAGGLLAGSIKSAVGLALILQQGIGDTLRVSLTGDPVAEVRAAKTILRTLGLRRGGAEVVSCPTCGRTEIDVIGLAQRVEELVDGYPLDIKVAVMGCAVNGPGEAREADLGIAGGRGEGLLFRKGEIVKKLPEGELLAALKTELDNIIQEK